MRPEEHEGEGLRQDLRLIRQRLQTARGQAPQSIERRGALKLVGLAAGLTALSGSSTLLSPRRALAATGSCTADAPETAGPFPADGTNSAPGETSDVLTESGVIRKDIRRSFLSTRTKAKGVEVRLDLTVINTRSECTPVSGFAVYNWHCDRNGYYSLYTLPGESYLRGVQVSDDSGRLSFVTIFPGCYPGRWPHMHLEIFTSVEEATNGRNAILTTQLAMPRHTCNEVYDNARGYAGARSNFANVSLESDSVFRDDTRAQLRVMTPEFTGSVEHGYTAKATLGVPA
jgi:protocatechuate 3,4-dioxygenase beta subunit